jgi:hypothetical protein
MSDIVRRLQAAIHDERLSCGALYGEAAAALEKRDAEIERLRETCVEHAEIEQSLTAEIKQLHELLREAERAYEGDIRIDVDEWIVRVRDALPECATEEK